MRTAMKHLDDNTRTRANAASLYANCVAQCPRSLVGMR
jgi:hypothetical protein